MTEEQEQRLDEIIAGYLQAKEEGILTDSEELIAANPEFEQELREFLGDLQQIAAVPAPLPVATISRTPVLGKLRYFGKYELLEEIARGGMGIVYKATQKNLNRIVAIKMIAVGHLAQENDVRRFQSEAESAANLQHPHIVSVHEVGRQDGQNYFSMDYIEGKNLSEIVREQPLPPRQAAGYVREIAEAIHYAHQQGTLHRDVKPSNVLIDQNDRVQITDFGLAMRVEGDIELTRTGQILGTPSYMSPEQAQHKRGLICPASDTYSIGAVLYELLTGRPPFRADSPMETLRQVVETEPLSPRLLNPAIPKDLETICLRCLQKEPHKRYETAQHLADDLGRFLKGEPILARPIGRLGKTWRWCKREPVVAGLSVTTATLLLGITLLTSWGFLREASLRRKLLASFTELRQQQAENENLSTALEQREAQKAALDKKIQSASQELGYMRTRMAGYHAKHGRLALAEKLLDLCPDDQRNWEWHYYKKQCDPIVMELQKYDSRTGMQTGVFDHETLNVSLAGETVTFGKGAISNLDEFDIHENDIFSLLNNYLEGVGAKNATCGLTSFAKNATGTRIAVGYECRPRGGSALCGVAILAVESPYEIERVIPWDEGKVQELSFGSNDRWLAANSERTGVIWDVGSKQKAFELGSNGMNIHHSTFTPDGKWLVTAAGVHGNEKNAMYGNDPGDTRTIKVWDIARGDLNRELDVSDARGVTNIVFDSSGERMATACKTMTIVWDFSTGKRILTIPESSQSVALHPTGRYLLLTSEGGSTGRTAIWDVDAAKEMTHQAQGGTGAAFHPEGNQFAVTLKRSGVRIFEFPSAEELFEYKTEVKCNRLAYHPSGERIAVAEGHSGVAATVEVFSSHTGDKLLAIPTGTSYQFEVAFSDDGKLLATANLGRINIWDAENGEPLISLPVTPDDERAVRERKGRFARGRVVQNSHLSYTVAFSPDNKRLMAGWGVAKENNVLIWDVATGPNSLAAQWELRQ